MALVTGGARGLGRGYALRLVGFGADIAIINRNLKGFEVYEFTRKLMTAPTVMDECLAEARTGWESYRVWYHHDRLHQGLKYRSPREYDRITQKNKLLVA